MHEDSGALVVRVAPLEDMALWLPASAGAVAVQLTASIGLPSGPKQLFSSPQTIEPGETKALPFEFTGLPTSV